MLISLIFTGGIWNDTNLQRLKCKIYLYYLGSFCWLHFSSWISKRFSMALCWSNKVKWFFWRDLSVFWFDSIGKIDVIKSPSHNCEKNKNYTWPNVEVLPNFRMICPKLCENCSFPQNFQTSELSEISIFYSCYYSLFQKVFVQKWYINHTFI